MPITPLNIQEKVDSPAKVLALSGVPTNQYMTNAETNAQVAKTNELVLAANASADAIGAISAGDAGKVYPTLAAAISLTPKPANGLLFQVSATTDAANAGYYSFQSTQANGVKFERSFFEKLPVYDFRDNTKGVTASQVESRLVDKFINNVIKDPDFSRSTFGNASSTLQWYTGNSAFTFSALNKGVKATYASGVSTLITLLEIPALKERVSYNFDFVIPVATTDAFPCGFDVMIMHDQGSTNIRRFLPTKAAGKFNMNGVIDLAKELPVTVTTITQVRLSLNFKAANNEVYNPVVGYISQNAKVLSLLNDYDFKAMVQKRKDTFTNLFADTATVMLQPEIYAFIQDIKITSGHVVNVVNGAQVPETYFVREIANTAGTTYRIDIRKVSDSSIVCYFYVDCALGGISTHLHTYNGISWTITLNKSKAFILVTNQTSSTNALLDNASLLYVKPTPDSYANADLLTNHMPNGNFAAGYDWANAGSNNPGSTPGGSVAGDVNGVTFTLNDYSTGNMEILHYGVEIIPNRRVGILVEYVLNSTNIPQQGTDAGFNVRLSSTTNSSGSFGGISLSAASVGTTFRECRIVDILPGATATTNGLVTLKSRMTFLGDLGYNISYTIKSIQLVSLGFSDSDPFYKISAEALRDLVFSKKYTPTNTSLSVARRTNFALNHNNPYYGRQLITWGHSVVETGVWQPEIAKHFGMIYSNALNIDGVDGYIETAIGGTYLVPIVADNDTKGPGKSHLMKLKAAFKYYNDKYTNEWGKPLHLFMFNFNDKSVGEKYIPASPYSVPADYGINDPAWTGGEVNLLTNPSTAVLPSFGAAYRAALNYVFLQDKGADIMLVTGYQATSYGSHATNGHNAVTLKMADEYCIPVINFHSTLWNVANSTAYLKDGIHPGLVGGKRMGQSCIRQM